MSDESIHLAALRPDDKNARRHTPRNVGMIVNALHEVGAARSIVIDENNRVLAGNATIDAAAQAGIENVRVVDADGNTIIAVRRTGLTEEQKRKLALYDNRTAELAEWDTDVLSSLADDGVDLSQFWFEDELADLLLDEDGTTEGLTDPDDVPDVPDEPITKPGDLWLLGRHRLLCGDSTNVTDVDRLMDGVKADMVFTDPPYGMDLRADWSTAKSRLDFAADKQAFGGRRYDNVIGDDEDFDPGFLVGYFNDCREVFLWGADYYAERILGKNDGSWFVWDKRIDESTDKIYGSAFELCWSKARHKRDIVRIRWAGIFGTEQEFDHKRHHPTQKPVALASWFVEKYSKPGDTIVDLYAGAGMTLLACEQIGREARLMEISPAYCDVIVKRYEKFTGETATRVEYADAAD